MKGQGGFCKGGRSPAPKFPQFVGKLKEFGTTPHPLDGRFEPNAADRRRLNVSRAKSAKGQLR